MFKKIKVGNILKRDIFVIVGTRFITIGCLLNSSFRIVYDQDEKKFINSCKYCGKICKIRKWVDRYIKRGEPFNFKDLMLEPDKKKRHKKKTIKKTLKK